jgi:hypothetical protein
VLKNVVPMSVTSRCPAGNQPAFEVGPQGGLVEGAPSRRGASRVRRDGGGCGRGRLAAQRVAVHEAGQRIERGRQGHAGHDRAGHGRRGRCEVDGATRVVAVGEHAGEGVGEDGAHLDDDVGRVDGEDRPLAADLSTVDAAGQRVPRVERGAGGGQHDHG